MRTKILVISVMLAIALAAAAQQKPAEPKISAGNSKLYIGVFPNKILEIDEASEKVSGEIIMKTGIPRGMSLSHNRKHFYVYGADMESVEVVDIAAKKVIDTFKLSEGDKKIRMRGGEVDPEENYMVVLTKATTKLVDRFEIGPPTILQYDLKAHKVLRTIPFPKNEEREFINVLFSPDGKFLYFFSEDVLIYETKEFKQVDKWEISRPIEDGFGRINFGSLDRLNEEPGFFTGLFQVSDPIQNRRTMGITRVNLSQKSMEFYTLGPANGVSFALAPDRKHGYGLLQQVGHYEFWTFDLANKKLHSKTEFPGRPRMALKVSSNGKVLYVYQAGPTIDLYDASSYQYLRTIRLDGDETSELFVMP